MNNLDAVERTRSKLIQPVEIPPRPRRRKDDLLPIRVNAQVKAYIESELAGLGLKNARDRQDFYRGAILAGIHNAKRAGSPAWQKFVTAIQPLARKHLGMGLELDGPKEIMESGGGD
jgi:hypothetical protein